MLVTCRTVLIKRSTTSAFARRMDDRLISTHEIERFCRSFALGLMEVGDAMADVLALKPEERFVDEDADGEVVFEDAESVAADGEGAVDEGSGDEQAGYYGDSIGPQGRGLHGAFEFR